MPAIHILKVQIPNVGERLLYLAASAFNPNVMHRMSAIQIHCKPLFRKKKKDEEVAHVVI